MLLPNVANLIHKLEDLREILRAIFRELPARVVGRQIVQRLDVTGEKPSTKRRVRDNGDPSSRAVERWLRGACSMSNEKGEYSS